MRNIVLSVLLIIVAAGCQSEPQDDGLRVGAIDLSDLKWGQTTVPLTVSNPSDYVRYVVISVETQFSDSGDSYLAPNRRTVVKDYLLPGGEKVLEPTVFVPGNYGSAEITFRVYDVVDTLDLLMPSYLISEKSLVKSFPAPKSVQQYRAVPIQLPPRVGEHPFYDNELSRLILLLIHEGKWRGEIAQVTGADTVFVSTVLDRLIQRGDIEEVDGELSLAFAWIGRDQVVEFAEEAEVLSDLLVERIRRNVDEYWAIVDSLASDSIITADRNLTMDRGASLYRLYPTVGGLFLWWDLGSQFITRSAPLVIFDRTDLCNSNIPTYMYAAQATEDQVGNHLYDATISANSYQFIFSDHLPEIICPDDFILRAIRGQRVSSRYGPDDRARLIMFDSSLVRPALEALGGEGIYRLLFDTYISLRDRAADKYGHARLDYGQRYWFWNLTATRTLEKLATIGLVSSTHNGVYRLNGWKDHSARGNRRRP